MEATGLRQILDELGRKQTEAMTVQSLWKPKYFEGYEFGLRRYGEVYANNITKGSPKFPSEPKYSSFTKQCVDKAVNKMQLNITPPQSDFIQLGLNDGEDVDYNYYSEESRRLNNWKNQSNYDSASKEFFADVLVGTGCLSVDVMEGRLLFTNIPFNQYTFTENSFGDIDNVFRCYQMKGREVNRLFKKANLPDDKDYIITEASTRTAEKYNYWQTIVFYQESNINPSLQTDSSTQSNIPSMGDREILSIGKPVPYCKYIIARWNKQTNCQYGQGKILDCMTEIKQLNTCAGEMARLVNLLLPVYLANSSAGITPRDPIIVGAINYIKQVPGSTQPPLQIFESDAKSLQGFMSFEQKLRQDIRDNLFIPDMMINISRTASELNDKINQMDTDLLAVFSSFQNEMVYSFVNTVMHLAVSNRIIDKIDEKNLYYNFDNQLTKVFKKNLPQLFTGLQIISNIDPQLLAIKKKELTRYIMEGSVPIEMLNTVDEQTAEEERQAQLQQEQPQQQLPY